MSAAPRANMGTAVSKRKTLRNEAMSSVAAKVRWVAAGRRRPRVQGSGPRPSPCGPAAAAGSSPAAGEARLEQGSVPVPSGSRGHGRCLARHPRVRGQSRRRCSRGLLPLSRDPPAWKPGPTASAPSRSVLSRHPGRPGGLGLPTVPVLVPCPLSYSAELSGPGAPSMEHRRSSKTHQGLGHA